MRTPRLLTALLVAGGLAMLAPGAASAADPIPDEVVTFNSDPAVVGKDATRIYATAPGLVLGEMPPLSPGGSNTIKNTSSCGVTVSNVAGHATPAGALACGGSTEFRDPTTLIGTFTQTTRTKVTMIVGDSTLDNHPGNPHRMRLLAYDARGGLMKTGVTQTITKAGVLIEVSQGQPEIAYFVLDDLSDNVSSGVWVDDITFDVPPKKGLASFRVLRTNPGTLGYYQGQPEQTVDISLFRVNGSNGDVKYTVSGLPKGVFARQVDSVNGKGLAFTVAPNAPTFNDYDHNILVTVTANNAGAGPLNLSLQVPLQITISPPIMVGISDARVTLPDCGRGGVDLSYIVQSWAGPAHFEIKGVPAGVTPLLDGHPVADWPSLPAIGQGTKRLTWTQSANLAGPATVTLTLVGNHNTPLNDQGKPAGEGQYTDDTTQTLVPPTPIKDVFPTSVQTPREMKPGTRVTIFPDGVCTGASTRVRFGNDLAIVQVAPGGDGSISAEVPRSATSGPLQVIPDIVSSKDVSFPGPQITVDSYRNTVGFAFSNYTPNLTVDQMSRAFGYDATHYSPNICSTFTLGLIKCKVSTPLPDPWAMTVLAVANATMGGGLTGGKGGACFGFSRTSQQLRRGALSVSSFGGTTATTAFGFDHRDATDVGGGGAQEAINANQLAQLSNEYLSYYASNAVGNALSQDARNLRAEIEGYLKKGDDPMISLRGDGGFSALHVVVAYDVETDETGLGYYIHVYDSNAPFLLPGVTDSKGNRADELTESGASHDFWRKASRIHVTYNGAWSLPSSPAENASSLGGIIVSGYDMPPAKPTLITAKNALSDGLTILVGWTLDGILNQEGAAGSTTAPSAHISQVTSGNRKLFSAPGVINTDPATALRGAPWAPSLGSDGAEGLVLAAGEGAAYKVDMVGDTPKEQTRTVLGENMVATVKTKARPGVTDQLAVEPQDDQVGFTAGGSPSPLDLQMMVRTADGSTRSVQAQTTTASKATDSVSFAQGDSQIEIEHQGPPATVEVTLSSTGTSGAPQAATTKVKVAANSTTSVKPANWKKLGGSKVTVKSKGKSRTTKLRRVGGIGARAASVTAAKPATKGGARVGKATITVPPTIKSGTASVTFILRRGKRVIATTSMEAGGPGTRTLSWNLPPTAKKGDQLSVVATTLIPLGKIFNSSTSTKTTKVKG